MFAASKTASVSGGYQISRSLRFNSADSAYLNRTPASAGNRKTWTWSGWVKKSVNGFADYQYLLSSRTLSTDNSSISFNPTTDELRFGGANSGNTINLITSSVYRDPSAWYHIVVAMDTTQATASDRLKMYVNGVQITSFSTSTYPVQNAELSINSTTSQQIGSYNGSATFNGYQTEVNFIDGQALTPSSFGETNAQTGVWQPKTFSGGAYGTNGFYLNFSDNSNTTAATLGKDYSGNGNNFTPNNFSVTAGAGNDSMVDVPTPYGVDTGAGGTVRGNYATINPLQLISNVAVSNGNLYLQSNNNQDQFASAPSTVAVRTGKWYAEYTAITVAGTPSWQFGVARASWSPIILDGGGYYGRWYYTSEGYSYSSNSNFYTNNATVGAGATYTNGDIIGIALNLDAGSIAFYKNGVLQGTPFTSITLGVDYVFAGGAFTTPYPTPTNIAAFFANYGQRPFAYTAPSGFQALCTQNLPTPTIGATTATQAGKFFNAVTYTGTGSSLGVTGVGFQPDWVWVKGRSGATDHALYDAVRGVQKQLESNTTTAETTETTGLTAFGSDGFTTGALAQLNTSSATYVAWNWKANGSGSSNTSGSITSTVSANTTSGFSVVTYTGNGVSGATVGHGLGVAPSMIIVKNRSGVTNWPVYHASLGNTKALFLSLTNAADTDVYWNNTTPTSSVFTITPSGTGLNGSGSTYVAYCFAEVAGYSKIGSYIGNGVADGPFIYCGFKPAFVMFKNASSSGAWGMYDRLRAVTYNPQNAVLYPNYSNAENIDPSYTYIDFVSNGIKIRSTGADFNYISGNTYIFMAFAENPFKYSLGR
jgi:hypothetical protein